MCKKEKDKGQSDFNLSIFAEMGKTTGEMGLEAKINILVLDMLNLRCLLHTPVKMSRSQFAL